MLSQKLTFDVNADQLVERIEASLRAGVLASAAQAAGELVEADARPRITAPGYAGDKSTLKPLQQSLTTVVREYPTAVVAVVGTAWPEGAHGHLVEFGHELVRGGKVIGHVHLIRFCDLPSKPHWYHSRPWYWKLSSRLLPTNESCPSHSSQDSGQR